MEHSRKTRRIRNQDHRPAGVQEDDSFAALSALLEALIERVAGSVAERVSGKAPVGKRLLTLSEAAEYLGRSPNGKRHYSRRDGRGLRLLERRALTCSVRRKP